MKETIRRMTDEEREAYYNPPEWLRNQRAQSYRRNFYEPMEAGDVIAMEICGHKYTQCEHLMQYLKDYASITPLEALTAFGCMRLGARVSDMREQGYDIRTEINAGHKKYAIYRWEEE